MSKENSQNKNEGNLSAAQTNQPPLHNKLQAWSDD